MHINRTRLEGRCFDLANRDVACRVRARPSRGPCRIDRPPDLRPTPPDPHAFSPSLRSTRIARPPAPSCRRRSPSPVSPQPLSPSGRPAVVVWSSASPPWTPVPDEDRRSRLCTSHR